MYIGMDTNISQSKKYHYVQVMSFSQLKRDIKNEYYQKIDRPNSISFDYVPIGKFHRHYVSGDKIALEFVGEQNRIIEINQPDVKYINVDENGNFSNDTKLSQLQDAEIYIMEELPDIPPVISSLPSVSDLEPVTKIETLIDNPKDIYYKIYKTNNSDEPNVQLLGKYRGFYEGASEGGVMNRPYATGLWFENDYASPSIEVDHSIKSTDEITPEMMKTFHIYKLRQASQNAGKKSRKSIRHSRKSRKIRRRRRRTTRSSKK